jgi:UDP-N-acetylglucosamine 2-epimerase (non-hydrolysing)
MIVIGTRPEAIKLAPVVLQLAASDDLQPVVALTGQHREMTDQVLDLFGIRADHDLDILQPGQTLSDVTVRALTGLGRVMAEDPCDAVMIQGDTTTAFAGALAAFYLGIPVAHVEAGLRTGNPRSPFPEEINRRLATVLTSIHLAPTPSSEANLLREAVAPESIFVTGNTVIDALLWTVEHQVDYGDPVLAGLDTDSRRVLLVTAHRRESWGGPMRDIGAALGDLARGDPDLVIVFPIHRNPLVRAAVLPAVEHVDNVLVVEPLAYGAFVRLMARADVILTDSGGVQEEAPTLGKPVLVMRDTTERPEAVSAGTVRLVGTDRETVAGAVRHLLDDAGAYAEMAKAVNPYGDGQASRRIAQALRFSFGAGVRPDAFDPVTPR